MPSLSLAAAAQTESESKQTLLRTFFKISMKHKVYDNIDAIIAPPDVG